MSEWISVKERLPEPETQVLICAVGYKSKIITTAIYEDGTIAEGESCWNWTDIDDNYDEERDEYLIPEGWWEDRYYTPDEVYNNAVSDVVTHWQPLPEPPKEDLNEI